MRRPPFHRHFIPADGSLRKSQVITTFGPGAMVDLVDQAVLIGGLDFWNYGEGNQGVRTIEETRLRDALQRKIHNAGDRTLSVAAPFREPPTCDSQSPVRSSGIQVLEFPRWFVCQGCRSLIYAKGGDLELKNGQYLHDCNGRGKMHRATPVRFVGTCPSGHLQDWPWGRFVHGPSKGAPCSFHDLMLDEGSRGDFSEIVVRCRSCQASRKLISALVENTRYACEGHRPWLGPQDREECNEKLRLMVRTASNSYFSQVVSALSIPEPSSALSDAVKETWNTVKVATAELLPAFRQIPDVGEALKDWSDELVLAEIEARKEGHSTSAPQLRTAEYLQFMQQPLLQPGDAPQPEDSFFARKIAPNAKHHIAWPDSIERVVIAPKLREVRAQVGFTRVDSITANLEGEYDIEELKIQLAQLGSESIDWLPAVEILGEGIWIRLDEDKVAKWEQRPVVRDRAKALLKGYQSWATEKTTFDFPGIRFYMLHSLSHLLLTAITLECGYAASSVRERLYCAPANADVPMAALLISTGTPGAEGTLGGLVDQAQYLGKHFRRAYDLGKLCSGDPVCSHHNPGESTSSRYLEGAACHACLFLAECSCERFNHFLDRALVFPCLGHPPDLAFFSERP